MEEYVIEFYYGYDPGRARISADRLRQATRYVAKLFASIFDFGTPFILLKNGIVVVFRHDLIRFGEKITEFVELPITTETNGFPLFSLAILRDIVVEP